MYQDANPQNEATLFHQELLAQSPFVVIALIPNDQSYENHCLFLVPEKVRGTACETWGDSIYLTWKQSAKPISLQKLPLDVDLGRCSHRSLRGLSLCGQTVAGQTIVFPFTFFFTDQDLNEVFHISPGMAAL